MTETLT